MGTDLFADRSFPGEYLYGCCASSALWCVWKKLAAMAALASAISYYLLLGFTRASELSVRRIKLIDCQHRSFMDSTTHRPPLKTKWKTLSAFAISYVVWGSTFLAIRIGVQEVPPFLLAAIRFSIADSRFISGPSRAAKVHHPHMEPINFVNRRANFRRRLRPAILGRTARPFRHGRRRSRHHSRVHDNFRNRFS